MKENNLYPKITLEHKKDNTLIFKKECGGIIFTIEIKPEVVSEIQGCIYALPEKLKEAAEETQCQK